MHFMWWRRSAGDVRRGEFDVISNPVRALAWQRTPQTPYPTAPGGACQPAPAQTLTIEQAHAGAALVPDAQVKSLAVDAAVVVP